MNSWRIGDVKISRVVELEAAGGTRFLLPDATAVRNALQYAGRAGKRRRGLSHRDRDLAEDAQKERNFTAKPGCDRAPTVDSSGCFAHNDCLIGGCQGVFRRPQAQVLWTG